MSIAYVCIQKNIYHSRRWPELTHMADEAMVYLPTQRLYTPPSLFQQAPGCDLLMKECCRFNRLRLGVGRFHHTMFSRDLADSSNCECGLTQIADHLVQDCPIHCLEQQF